VSSASSREQILAFLRARNGWVPVEDLTAFMVETCGLTHGQGRTDLRVLMRGRYIVRRPAPDGKKSRMGGPTYEYAVPSCVEEKR
jgi:hypothetical protein